MASININRIKSKPRFNKIKIIFKLLFNLINIFNIIYQKNEKNYHLFLIKKNLYYIF